MAATDLAVETTSPSSARRSRRRLRPRVSAGHVVTVVAALLAFVANVAVLRGDGPLPTILVADTDIAVGQPISEASVRAVAADLEDGLLAGLVPGDEVASALSGKVAATRIPAGAPIRRADLVDPASLDPGLRRISVPVEPELAVGGRIAPEDHIDVIRVRDGVATYLVSGARVLSVGDTSTSGLGSLGRFHITIAVDADTALCLAEAISTGGISVTLATGQDPAPTTPCASIDREERDPDGHHEVLP